MEFQQTEVYLDFANLLVLPIGPLALLLWMTYHVWQRTFQPLESSLLWMVLKEV